MRIDGAVSGCTDEALAVDEWDMLTGFAPEVLSKTEINEMEIFAGLSEADDKVFGLDITMDYIFPVECLHSCNRLFGEH